LRLSERERYSHSEREGNKTDRHAYRKNRDREVGGQKDEELKRKTKKRERQSKGEIQKGTKLKDKEEEIQRDLY
jgi:hypothetical protein